MCVVCFYAFERDSGGSSVNDDDEGARERTFKSDTIIVFSF